MYVLITGASKGIGKALAEVCAANGHHVVLVARSKDALTQIADKLQNQYNIQTHVIVEDLTKPDAIDRIIKKLNQQHIIIDCLINNAGIGYQGDFVDMSIEGLSNMMTLNMLALTRLTKHFAEQFKQQKHGKILQIASIAGFQPGPSMALYYATKAFVLNFSQALFYELKEYGVSVTTVCPGPTKTQFFSNANLEKSRLNSGLIGKMSAESVAKKAYSGMMRGKRMVIPGIFNKILAWGAKITPTYIQLRMTRFLHQPQ